jgi:hypothetical protein
MTLLKKNTASTENIKYTRARSAKAFITEGSENVIV